MSPIRRLISMILALALLIAGTSALCYLLFLAHGWRGWMVMGAGLVASVGGVWLWDDFINATPNQ
jgi:CHASE2 domain-containing sensor protein